MCGRLSDTGQKKIDPQLTSKDSAAMNKTESPTQKPVDIVGGYRSFGEYGPVYQILGTVNGVKVHVCVVQTGEELDYPLEQALADPIVK